MNAEGLIDYTALVWGLQFEHPYIFDLETLNIYLISKRFYYLLPFHLPIYIEKWKIEPVNKLSQAIKNYSRRHPTKYSLKYRNPEWVLKKAIKFDDYKVASSVVKTVSSERKEYYATWVGLNNYTYNLGDFYRDDYQLGVDLRNGIKRSLPREEFIVLLARYRGKSAVKDILSESSFFEMKYRQTVLKTGDLDHIKANIDALGWESQRVAWRMGRSDLAEAFRDENISNENISMTKILVASDEYMQLLYGGQIHLINQLNFSILAGYGLTLDGSFLLCALYSMKIDCILSVFRLGPVDCDRLAINPVVRNLGKSPGETTPEKLIKIKELLLFHNIDVVKIKFVFLHFVIRNDDVESVPTLLEHYGVTAKDVGDYVHLGATTIAKVYPNISRQRDDLWLNDRSERLKE